jgi:hypothetical protein
MPALKHHLPDVHDQLDYLSDPSLGVEALPLGWRKCASCPIDFSGTRARRRRFNNVHLKAPAGIGNPETRWWNSGYWPAVLISPMHAIVPRHYRAAVPSQVNELQFIGRSMQLYQPKVSRILHEVGEDLDVIEFERELPRADLAIADRIADMRTARRGLPIWLQTSQHMTMRLDLDQVATIVETGGAMWASYFTAQPAKDGPYDSPGGDGSIWWFSGDSGSPTFCADRWGRQCLVGLHWASPTIAAGGTSKAAREFEALRDVVGTCGYTLELADVAPADADIDGDGRVDARDLSILQAEWGRANSRADVDANGIVDARDMAAVLAGWRN